MSEVDWRQGMEDWLAVSVRKYDRIISKGSNLDMIRHYLEARKADGESTVYIKTLLEMMGGEGDDGSVPESRP